MKNKKAQEMSTGTIILLILGLVVLVVLILGFTLGWDTFLPFLKNNNIESIKTTCQVACTTNNAYDFCTASRSIKDGVNEKFTATCDELSSGYSDRAYGINPCNDLCSA